jgi:hypothetical protein
VPYHGDDSYRAVLEPLLRSPGVTLRGWLPEPRCAARLRTSMCWWCRRSGENSPLVIHEALHSRVPVVASNIGGIPEHVRHSENGLLFPSGDVPSLRAALQRLSDEPAIRPRLASIVTPVRTIEDDTLAMRADYAAAALARDAAPSPSVHAVVLNYRTPEQTLLTVRSLLASTQPLAAVTVVDNSDWTAAGCWQVVDRASAHRRTSATGRREHRDCARAPAPRTCCW